MQVQVVNGIAEISQNQWERLQGQENPFLDWRFLNALEETGCVGGTTGWIPVHHLLRDESGQLIAACPAYLKWHSMGEFVYDFDWAAFAQTQGIEYYPKLLLGIPFTPALGPRFLLAPDVEANRVIPILLTALDQLALALSCHSINVNFCTVEEGAILEKFGFLARKAIQFHWRNRDYGDFEAYLADMKRKRRGEIRRERRRLQEQGVTFHVTTGTDLSDADVDLAFRLYAGHVRKFVYGGRYLNRSFFRKLRQVFSEHVVVVRGEQAGRPVGGSFNIVGGKRYYGRYWGCLQDIPYLHFAACYYEGIAYCIRLGLQVFEPGAGGEFKQLRGFDPQETFSYHRIFNARLRQPIAEFLQREAIAIDRYRLQLMQQSELRERT